MKFQTKAIQNIEAFKQGISGVPTNKHLVYVAI